VANYATEHNKNYPCSFSTLLQCKHYPATAERMYIEY